MKKSIKIGMLVAMLAMVSSVFAQENEYPRYSFWSNWSVGGELTYSWQFAEGTPIDWRTASNVGLGIFAEKELSHIWALRLRMTAPGLWKPIYDSVGHNYDRYGRLGLDAKFSITGAAKGYDPDRKNNFYLVAGAGLATMFQRERFGILATQLTVGLGFSRKCCEHSSWFVEYDVDNVADFSNVLAGNWMNLIGNLNLGWMYNFGPTAADQALIAERALLTKERFDALTNDCENLKKDLAESKANEKKLQARVNELENERDRLLAEANGKNTAAADSLQAVIDQLKADQLTYYAMPFSVQYAVNEWHVNDTEMVKLQAIARVMKDNPDVKVTVVGFCDYTGSDAYNMKLSERRAKEVKRLLVKRYGIAEDRLTVDAKGKTAPFGDLKYELNRRVSFYRVIE